MTARTLDAAVPGWTTTVGGFGHQDGSGGTCTVRRGDHTVVEVNVTYQPDAAARQAFLAVATDTTDPPPTPTDLGDESRASDDGRNAGSIATIVGPYTIGVSVRDADTAEAAVDAATIVTRELCSYYRQQTHLMSESPTARP